MNGAGCCGGCGNAPQGTATGPVDQLGIPVNRPPCGCTGSSGAKVPWLLLALIVGFFVLVKK
jgi:hypothetical protein